ncbi:MAG: hypothetical protein WD941_05270 [Opitutus sp.]
MTQRAFVALMTVVVFFAGYGARMATERGRGVPPPPAVLAHEYMAPAASGGKGKYDVDRAKLVAEIEKLRPQIEAYRAQVDEIYAEFDREFGQILSSEQRTRFAANEKRWAEHIARRQADPKPLSDEDILRARERPMSEVYWMVTVTPRLERLTREYSLNEAQQGTARALLSLRRNKFIALLDSTPHPGIRLSRLAPLIERVAAPDHKDP